MKKPPKRRKTGMIPGSLVHTGKQEMDTTEITVIQYNENDQSRKEYYLNDLLSIETSKENITWLNVDGLHDIEQVKKIGEKFELHQLLLEDVLSIDQRPKVEKYNNCIFVSLKMFHLEMDKLIDQEQISVVLKANAVISFQEKPGDVFDGIRSNILRDLGQIRKKNADFLIYRMLDTVVDNYFLIVDFFEDRINELEENIDVNKSNHDENDFRQLKKQVLNFRKDIRPLNDAVQKLLKEDIDLIDSYTKTYLNDVYDHLAQIIDALDVQRESLTYLTDQYHTQQGIKLNKVMKLLTIVSTVFIPLTFIVGVYGMNFRNMPELKWEYGYYLTWGLMIVITFFMIALFKYKKWW